MTSPFRTFQDSVDTQNAEINRESLLTDDKELVYQCSNFQYMPVHFRGLLTKDMGMVAAGTKPEDTPFFKLKAIAESEDELPEDRMQALRYMCFIPYKDQLLHLISSCDSILKDTRINIYKRYHFFSNNQAYLKLNDHLVFHTFYSFWKYLNEIEGPLELRNLCARYVIGQYPRDDSRRQNVLDWIIDWLEGDLDVRSKADLADVLKSCGDWDEASYGSDKLKELGGSSVFVENAENVHTESLTDSAIAIIRTLQAKRDQLQSYTIIDVQNMLLNEVNRLNKNPLPSELNPRRSELVSRLDAVQHFIYRSTSDPTLYAGLSLGTIICLIYSYCCGLSETVQATCWQRWLEEVEDAHNTCSTGYLLRCCNVLQGLVDDRDLQLRLSPEDELRNILFGRMNESMSNLGPLHMDEFLASISGDGVFASEMVELYDAREDVWDDYKAILSRDEFDTIVDRVYKSYLNK